MLRIILFLLIIMLTGCGQAPGNEKSAEPLTGYVGEREPVTRAEAAKMLALSQYTLEEINDLERIIAFKDTDITKWYDKYINAAYTAGLIAGADSSSFAPEESLTLRQAQVLVKKLNTRGSFELKYNQADRDKPISYKIWLEAFTRAAEGKVTSCNIFVCATGRDCKELSDKYIICNGGLRGSEGVELYTYRDKIINVVMKDTEILGVTRVVNSAPTLERSEITQCGGSYVTIKLRGAERRLNIDNSDNKFKKGDFVNINFNEDGGYTVELCN